MHFLRQQVNRIPLFGLGRPIARHESTLAASDNHEVIECTTPKRSRRRKAAYIVAGLISVLLVAFFGVHIYFQIAEWLDPSGRVYVEVNGERIFLEQPMALVTPRGREPTVTLKATLGAASGTATMTQPTIRSTPATTAAEAQGAGTGWSGQGLAAETTSPTTATVVLPPLQLQIPAIDLDVPVVLADNQNLPRVPLAGWFFKSAFPATAGNTVLIGHVNGEAAIFSRLAELEPGDEIRIITEDRIHIYVADSSQIVSEDATEVLLPTDESTVTLITCTGDWLPQTRTFTHRLVVRGYYAAVEDRSIP